jgi:methylase of polypeptide subunit release factors
MIISERNNYLRRHTQFLDRRISVLADICKKADIGKIATNDIILSLLHASPAPSGLPTEIYPILSEIKTISDGWDILSDGDLFGYIYQNLETTHLKKKKGQFFTPAPIVEHLIESAIHDDIDIDTFRILDPSCGSGQFLIAAYKRLRDIYFKNGYPQEMIGTRIITHNLYGYDTDPIAIEIAKYNLRQISGRPISDMNIYKFDYIFGNDLFSKLAFPDVSFAAIVGNPPWGLPLTKIQKEDIKSHYMSARSGINSFTLFIEQTLRHLTDNGTICFLIPEAYLNIRAHQSSRTHVLENTLIREITFWGEQFKNVFAPSISIILEKCTHAVTRAKHIINVRQSHNIRTGTAALIPQKYYASTFQNIFNINYTHRAESIINKIHNSGDITLENNARFFLGIVTGANKTFLQNKKDDLHPDPILIAKDIDKFRINHSGHHFKYCPESLQQVAPRDCYLNKTKIIYKFIGKKLTFAYDNTGYYILNNINGFIPRSDLGSPEYIVALLNSSIVQYYYEKSYFTIKVLKGNIEKIPLRFVSTIDMKKVSILSESMSHATAQGREKFMERIDDIFFSAYGISDKEAYKIKNLMYQNHPDQFTDMNN